MSYFNYQTALPPPQCQPYIECYWQLTNTSEENKTAILLPDGRIDLIFSQSFNEPFHASLMGISTQPEKVNLDRSLLLFGVSLKLPAAEYVLGVSVAELTNSARRLPDQFWGVKAADLNSFDDWHHTITQSVSQRLPVKPDQRKLKLHELLYATHGALAVGEYADRLGWSPRQLNRYFNRQFGLPLKTYCEVLRFRAGVGHIQEGKLYPEEKYTDQSHFIKEVKRLAGVSPKNLYRNDQDQFIQLLVPPIS